MLIKANKSPVLVAKLQDMTGRYDFAILQKQIFFFPNWKNFFELFVFYFIYCIIPLI